MDALIAGRYRLLEIIGSGGEAKVYRAEDQQTKAQVAVRFGAACARAESHMEGRHHPGWVARLDTGSDPERGSFEVFEFLEGETLALKTKRGPLPNEMWRDLVEQSLAAVGAVHAAGFAHGDLNAENFFYDLKSGQWKLLELPFYQAETARSAAFGSIHTLAPEQLAGKPADARSDLYALGCLYYFAAAGEYPHAGNNHQEIAISLLRFAPVSLVERAPHLSREMAAWVMRLLEREPGARPQTAGQAHEQLRAVL